MPSREDIDKLNSLLAEVNALAEKINKEYSMSAIIENEQPDVLAHYKSVFQEDRGCYVYFIDSNSEVNGICNVGTFPFSESDRYVSDYYNPYHMYLSEEYAKKAAKMKKFNDMLLAYKWCRDKAYEPNWSDSNSIKCYVYYDTSYESYTANCTYDCDRNTVYFSTRITAEDCADWLNSIDPKGELVR